MKTSDNGIKLIKEFEGLFLTAYFCPANIPTIGYGHTATVTRQDVKNKKTITENEANILLVKDLAKYEKAVNELITVDLTQNEFDALVSFTFNLGIGSLASSTLRKLINLGKKLSANEQFIRWNKARVNGRLVTLKGLTRRRKAESNLFSS